MIKPTITAFRNSPDSGRGLARDMQVRWALEEAGQDYDVRLLTFTEMKEPAHRALHPFGQIPTYEQGGFSLFESGAIVLHIAECYGGLLPQDASARARAKMWMFVAVGTVEPPIVEWSMVSLLDHDKPWLLDRLSATELRVRATLGQLASRLDAAEWLEGSFSAGDLMMISVLRRLGSSPLLECYPAIRDYVARGEARPAFQRAFADQLAIFKGAQGD